MNRVLNRRITFDVPKDTSGHPGIGDYLVTRIRTGHYGTAYLIVGTRLVKRRKPDRDWRRYALLVQRQPEISVEVLRAAKWWLRWRPKRTLVRPELIGAA